MMLNRKTLTILAVSTALSAISLQSAFAQEATAVADRIKAVLANQGIDIAWAKVSGNASVMVLENVEVKPASEANSLPIGNITLSGVSDQAGGFHIDTVTTAPFSKSEDGITLDLSPLVINGMNVPADGNTDPMAALMMYESAELASMTVKKGDKTAFSLTGLGFELTPPEGGKAMEFTGAADKFTADLTLVDDPQSKAVIDALGYQNIAGDIAVEGLWQPTDGQFKLSQYDISVENAGTLGMTTDLGGYTMDFIKSAQEVSKKMAEAKDGDNSAAGMAMLGLMQQLTLNGATIRFDDDSLTNKILDFVGKQQNMSGKDIANQAKAIIPFVTGQLNNPELAAQISTAVNAFLDDPQNIEVAAAPAAPVPFAQIMAAGMANPLDLTKTLGVKVTANQ